MKKTTLFVITLILVLAVVPASAQQSTTVTLLHFSDYHSHAVPFYSEGQENTALQSHAPTPTATPSSVPTPVPPTSEMFPEDTYVLEEERVIGPYAIRVWRNETIGSFFANVVTISAVGQPTVQIELAPGLGDLTGTDITGEGHPDVIVEIYTGGAHCCFSTVVYDLGPTLTKVMETRPSNCGGDFEDLDGDGVFEFVTCDDLFAYVYCCYAGSPAVTVVLQYEPGEGYVPASPSFPEIYSEDIARDQEGIEGAVPGDRCEWDNTTKCSVLPLVLDYLYSGQADMAWSEFERLYNYPDAALFRSEIELAVSNSPLFVSAGPSPPNPDAPPYYMLQLLSDCDLDVNDVWQQPFIGLLTEGQSACDPEVLRRDLFWLDSQLSQTDLLSENESVTIAPEGCTTNCQLDVLRYTDDARVGSIRLDTTGGFPGEVYRVNGEESAHWRLKGDLTWEMIEEAPAEGAALLEERCTACHTLDLVKSAAKTAEDWQATVDRMKGKGAQLNDEEIRVLVEYLAATYKP